MISIWLYPTTAEKVVYRPFKIIHNLRWPLNVLAKFYSLFAKRRITRIFVKGGGWADSVKESKN